jgi:hypothetical protein
VLFALVYESPSFSPDKALGAAVLRKNACAGPARSGPSKSAK